jgi:hypothetical protein
VPHGSHRTTPVTTVGPRTAPCVAFGGIALSSCLRPGLRALRPQSSLHTDGAALSVRLQVERPNLLTFFESPAFHAPLKPWVHYVPVRATILPACKVSTRRAPRASAADGCVRGRGSRCVFPSPPPLPLPTAADADEDAPEMPRYADTAWDAFCVASLCPARQVAADLSNLVERANWVLSHPAEARRVAARALTYANCFLTREYVRRYMARQLLAASVCAEECFADRQRQPLPARASLALDRAFRRPPRLDVARSRARRDHSSASSHGGAIETRGCAGLPPLCVGAGHAVGRVCSAHHVKVAETQPAHAPPRDRRSRWQ